MTQTKAKNDDGQEKMSHQEITKPAIVTDKICLKVQIQPICLEKAIGISFVQSHPNKICKI